MIAKLGPVVYATGFLARHSSQKADAEIAGRFCS
jgi:hypothetical protein